MLVFLGEWKTGVSGGEPLRAEDQQTQPTYDAESGNRTRATSVEGECSHHYATTAYKFTP